MKFTKSPSPRVYIVLLDVRSVYNVASIFRTANCLGVSNIILAGYTPTPRDRFGRLRKDFSKVALGAEATLAWQHFPKISDALSYLEKEKVFLVAVEQAPHSTDYKKVKPQFPCAFIFGNEVEGVPPDILKAADSIAEIPMHGAKESLNVSVAVGIAVARMLNR